MSAAGIAAMASFTMKPTMDRKGMVMSVTCTDVTFAVS
jgi:hypothetical protein